MAGNVGVVAVGVLTEVSMSTSGLLIDGVEIFSLLETLVSTPFFPRTPVANKIPKTKLARASNPRRPQQTGPHQFPFDGY